MLALGANGRGRAGLLSALRPQDVFATSLYTGTGSSQTITTGVAADLIWRKNRSAAQVHGLWDKLRGSSAYLDTSSTAAEAIAGTSQDFLANGFVAGGGTLNNSGNNYAAWSFRRASKVFDIVTYTGDGTSGRVIPHALGIPPGMVIVKQRDGADNWPVYHRSAPGDLFLNLTNQAQGARSRVSAVSATGFTVESIINSAGATYVAYLFAHDPDTTNGIVQCGSFTTDGSGNGTATTGWPVQFALIKCSNQATDWLMLDTTRGWGAGTDSLLRANVSNAEFTTNDYGQSTSTGFSFVNIASSPFVYLAIRAPI